MIASLALFALALPAATPGQPLEPGSPAARLEKDLQADLTSAYRETKRLLGGWQTEQVPAGRVTALTDLFDRIKAADLLITAQHRALERRLEAAAAPSAIRERQARMSAAFREELDRIASLMAAIESAKADAPRLRTALAALVRRLEPRIGKTGDRTPLSVTLPYRSLGLPQTAPQLGAAIVPAYQDRTLPAPGPADLAEAPDVPLVAELVAQARALHQDPIEVFEFVHNQIAVEFYPGAMKGALETLRQKRGNDVDQASLLIALMRASGVPARYVRGVITLAGPQAVAWTGVSSTRRVAELLTRAGIPFVPVRQGGTIGSFQVEHTWVEAHVPYSNYRGAPLDTAARAWIPLDPSMKSVAFAPGEDVLAAMGFEADTLVAEYLAGPQTLSPAAFYKKKITDYLAQNRPDLTFAQAIGTLTVQPVSSGLLPSTLAYPVASVNQEYAALPDALRHQVRFVAQGEDGTAFDVTLAASDLLGRRLTLSYVPATVEDQITANAFLGLDRTPAYLVKVRPVLKVGGVIRGTGEAAVQMGATHDFRIEIKTPRGMIPISNTVLAGGYYAIGLGAQKVVYQAPDVPAPEDTERPVADLLYRLAADYLERGNQAERELGDILRVVPVRPALTEVMVGSVYNRTLLFGQPQEIEWRGVFVDADLRLTDPVPIGSADERRKEFMRLAGLAGSMAEGEVLESNLEVDAVSAARLIQLARAAGIPVDEIDASNVATALPLLETAEVVKTEIADAVRQGWRATVPRTDFARKAWSGIGYVLLDPATGAGGYFISGGLAGGMSSEDPHDWVRQQYADELSSPNADRPNTDPAAAASITKVAITDKQHGTVGKKLERDLAVWVRDVEGRPVQGADVTFTILAGGGDFDGAQTITVQSDNLGVATCNPTLGKKTSVAPFYAQLAPDDVHLTRIGQNVVTAKVARGGGDLPLDLPFQLFAHPGPPHHVVKVHGDDVTGREGTSGGTVLARVVDEYENPVSNVPVAFTVLAPHSDHGPLPADAVNLVIYPSVPRCGVPLPLHGDCEGESDHLTVTTSAFGASVETILGNTVGTIFRVQAAAAELTPQVFLLQSQGERAFGTGTYFAPALTMTLLYLVNDDGRLLNAAKVGTAFKRPLGIGLYLVEDNYVVEPTGIQPCGPGTPDHCFRVKSLETQRIRRVDVAEEGDIWFDGQTPREARRDKIAETATVSFNPTLGDGATNPSKLSLEHPNEGRGLYFSTLAVGPQPSLNRVLVEATAKVWTPCFDLDDGTVDPQLVTMAAGQTVTCTGDSTMPPAPALGGFPRSVAHEVFGVRARLARPVIVLVGSSGGTVKDFDIEYAIEPAEYAAAVADLDLLGINLAAEQQDDWLGSVALEQKFGSGTGRLFQGTAFDPARRYRMQVVLNRGSEVEVKSDKEKLDAYLAAPLGADFRSRANTAENGRRKREIDLAGRLRDEKAVVAGVISKGLDQAEQKCNLPIPTVGLSMIEQGSGACFWRSGFSEDPLGTCAAFQPGVSDHDYEVYIPSAFLSGRECLIGELHKAAREADVGEVTFFAVPKEEFHAARLNVDPPTVPGGSDPTGDLGLGRQTLLLKWVLEGEYVDLPGLFTPTTTGATAAQKALPLETILEKLRTTPIIPDEQTGIPALEGYETAIRERYGFYKSRAHLRLAGESARDPKSQLFELQQEELRGAAKAAIRAAVGRLLVDPEGQKLLFITRAAYHSDGCRTGTEDPSRPRPPLRLFPKRCDSFEEHIVSAAVRSLDPDLGIFTEAEVRYQVYDFSRLKAQPPCAAERCTTRIMGESAANDFLGLAVNFIKGVESRTKQKWEDTRDKDTPPRAARRASNAAAAEQKAAEARATAKRKLEVRVFNDNAPEFHTVPLNLHADAPDRDVAHAVPHIAPRSETIVDVKRDPSGIPIPDPEGRPQPIFEISLPGTENHQATVVLDPENRILECNKRDNYSGFFSYPLDEDNPDVPTFPPLPDPPVPIPSPPPECEQNPVPSLKLTKLVNGQPDIAVAFATPLKITHVIENTGPVRVDNIVLRDELLERTYGPVNLLPGGRRTFEDEYQPMQSGTQLIAPTEAVGFVHKGGVASAWDSVRIAVVPAPCRAIVVTLDPDPNPYQVDDPMTPPPPGIAPGEPISRVMQGGNLFRYYRVLDASGEPMAGVELKVSANGSEFTGTTDDEGVVRHAPLEGERAGGNKGLQLDADVIGPPRTAPYRVEFVSVAGAPSVCSQPFWALVERRESTQTLKAGTSIKMSGAFAGLQLSGAQGFGLDLGVLGSPGANTLFTIGRDINAEIGLGLKGTAAKGKVKLIGEAALATAEATAGISPFLSLHDTHEFPVPLDVPSALGIGQLLLTSALMSATAGGSASPLPGGPVFALVLTEVLEQLSGLDAYRSGYGTSLGVKLSAGISGKLPTLSLKDSGIPGLQQYGLGLGAEAGVEAAVTASFDRAPVLEEFGTGVEYRAQVDLAAGLDLGKRKAAAVISGEGDQQQLEFLLTTVDDLQFRLNFKAAGSVTFATTIDTSTDPMQLKQVRVSLSGEKGFGFKLPFKVADEDVSLIGKTKSIDFIVTDPAKLDEAVERITLIQALFPVAVATGPAIGPLLVGDEVAQLLRLFDGYETKVEKGNGIEIPIGLSAFLEGTGLEGEFALNLDNSVEFPVEKGAMRKAGMFKLERYTDDDLIPDPATSSVPLALLGEIFNVVKQQVRAAYTHFVTAIVPNIAQPFTDIFKQFSPSGVRLRIDNAAEAAPFDVDLVAFQYRPTPGPVGLALQDPSDVAGPADRPHYGIGGFFDFAPESKALAAPATLTISYLDSEVAAVEESTLAIYEWSAAKRDWDYIGGNVDLANNSVTATVHRLGLYTVGARMPAGAITFTHQSAPGGSPSEPTTLVTYTSGALRMNTGQPVPDGTMFTVQAIVPHASAIVPFGTITSADEDPLTDGVQVSAHDGSIHFTAEHPGAAGVVQVLAFPDQGTALGSQVLSYP